MEKYFVNGFENWHETHFEIVSAIALSLDKDLFKSEISKIYEDQGRGGMYELARDLTNKFEEEFKGVLWGEELEYFTEIEKFIEKNLM